MLSFWNNVIIFERSLFISSLIFVCPHDIFQNNERLEYSLQPCLAETPLGCEALTLLNNNGGV